MIDGKEEGPVGKEKRIRDFTWDDYGISAFKYRELKNFCLQYDEKKSKIQYGIKAINNDGMPHGTNTGNPVEAAAIENLMNAKDCRLIEEAAIAANPTIWKYMLRSVTSDLPYELVEYDEETGKIPIGKTDFYGYRRLFFKNLHLLKIGDKLNEVM